jgi:hypothetical protein
MDYSIVYPKGRVRTFRWVTIALCIVDVFLEKGNYSMKSLLTAALILGLASAASAQDAKVPTGIDVQGCTRYVLTEDGKVVQNCTADTDPKQVTDPNDAQSRVRNGGDTGQ